jgi:hypothetical protein
MSEEKPSRLEQVKEALAKATGSLTGFAVEAGSAGIVILICWAITKIVKDLLV